MTRKLWAVKDDINSHGNGQLIPSGTTVTVNKKLVIVHSADNANPDDLCLPLGPPHCNPKTASGSSTVRCYGKPVHRQDDLRVCGATTTVVGQTNVFVGG